MDEDEVLLFRGGVISDGKGRIICLKENGELKIFQKRDRRIAYRPSEVAIELWPGDQLIIIGSELWADDYYYTIRGNPPRRLYPPVDWRKQSENIWKAIELADKLSAKEVKSKCPNP